MTADRYFKFALGGGVVMLTGLLTLNVIMLLCGAVATLTFMVLGWMTWGKE